MPFSRAHYRLVSPPADTPGTIADRRKRIAAGEQVAAERRELYPVITVDNADEVIAFQERRYRELYPQAGI